MKAWFDPNLQVGIIYPLLTLRNERLALEKRINEYPADPLGRVQHGRIGRAQ
jgi:hypothetical protein